MNQNELMEITREYIEVGSRALTATAAYKTSVLKSTIDFELKNMSITDVKNYYGMLMHLLANTVNSLGDAMSKNQSTYDGVEQGNILFNLIQRVQNRLGNTKFNIDSIQSADNLYKMYEIRADYAAYNRGRPALGVQGVLNSKALERMSTIIAHKELELTQNEKDEFRSTLSAKNNGFDVEMAYINSSLNPIVNVTRTMLRDSDAWDMYSKMRKMYLNYVDDRIARYSYPIVGLISVADKVAEMYSDIADDNQEMGN